ncbi:MAG TPA: hypothetical protein IAC56_05930 [Candidatus Aphodousia faecigallinarum]|uniref:Type-F conjugative transfer system protein TraW n=1 Tax=Candidatus Aphodousia faecigallinarum TaxID=2840677 RepID=A0A9D1LGD8_9BURK|nr:hypothetical protein [Candidatus Aphodousia faecigallinarum]
MKDFLLISLFLTIAFPSLASVALGPVYPVIEPDLLALLKTHAREEGVNAQSRLNRNRETLKRWAQEPKGQKLSEATSVSRQRFEAASEVKSLLGESYRREWLLIDANRLPHMRLARAFIKDKPLGRVILVAGSVEKTQNTLKTRVWFDQGATLVNRLQIKSLPAFVSLSAKGITVTEAPAEKLLKEP